MRTPQLFSLLAVALLLAPWLAAAPAPLPKRTKSTPLEAAYARIRVGMTERELVALMAPFQRSILSRYAGVQGWTDGRREVVVTIRPDEFPNGDGPVRVQAKVIGWNDETRIPDD
jgi:hypothetical protein